MNNLKPSICISFPVLLYSLAIAVVFLLIRGYEFNSGDQAEHLPLVYKALDSALYAKDYFVTASESTFTVRYAYVQVVTFFSYLIGVPSTVFICMILCLTLSAWAFWCIGYFLSGNCLAGYLSPVFVLFVFYNYFTLGTDLIQGNVLVSGSFGLAFATVSIAFFIMKGFRLAFFFLGIAGLFHVMFSFNLFLLLFTAYVLFYRTRYEWIILGSLYISICGLVLIPILLKQTTDTFVYDKHLYYQIQYIFRNYHHFMPSLFPLSHYIKFSGLSFVGMLLLLFLPVHQKKVIYFFYIAVILGFAVYALCLEGLDLMFVGKTQWPKGTTIWVSMFSSVIFAIALAEIWKGLVHIYLSPRFVAVISFVVAFFGLLVLTNQMPLPAEYAIRYKAGNYPKDDLYMMHHWIEQNTPKDAVFLLPATNDRFGCESKRSAISGYRAIVHEPFFMMPWFDTFCLVYHVTLDDGLKHNVYDIVDERYHTYNVKMFSERNLDIDYRLVDMSACQYLEALGAPLHIEGNWGLYKY